MDNTRKFILILGVLENGKMSHMYANYHDPISTCIIYESLLELECYIDENIKGVCCQGSLWRMLFAWKVTTSQTRMVPLAPERNTDEMSLVNSTSDDRYLIGTDRSVVTLTSVQDSPILVHRLC